MSMTENPVWDAGLVINLESDAGQTLLKSLIGEEELTELQSGDYIGNAEWSDIAYSLPNTAYYRANGEEEVLWFYPLDISDGTPDFRMGESLNGNYFCTFCSRSMKFFGEVCKSLDELVASYKELLGEYLPEDFDYASRIGLLVGSYFG